MVETDRRRNVTRGELDDYKRFVAGRLSPLEADVKRIREIVEAWNNAKGFVNTIKAISAAVKVLAILFAAAAAVWFFITNGHWPSK